MTAHPHRRVAAAQPRALVARAQRAGARARRRRVASRCSSGSRSAAIFSSEPRRVLHGARRRAARAGGAGVAVRSADGLTPQQALAEHPRAGARARRAPGEAVARASCARRSRAEGIEIGTVEDCSDKELRELERASSGRSIRCSRRSLSGRASRSRTSPACRSRSGVFVGDADDGRGAVRAREGAGGLARFVEIGRRGLPCRSSR